MEKNETSFHKLNFSEMNAATIIEAFDEHLTHEQKKLMINLNYQKKREEIEKVAKELKGDIKNLAKTIQDILDKHHKDYISTFSTFMDTVRKDLKLKLEQMEKIEEEKRKINDIKLIKCERDYFRLESIRLNNLCNKLNSKVEDMTLRMKILSDEVSSLTLKWKDSESANKQLFLELESSLQSQREIEKEMLEMKDMLEKNKATEFENYSKGEEEDSKEKFLSFIEKLKAELKKEKIRSHKAASELNKIMLEKNKLENIFIDCVEETRKNIYNRRIRDNFGYKFSKPKSSKNYEGADVTTKYETFLTSDKKMILENFVFNDEVSNIIREAIFNKPTRDKELRNMTKTLIGRINLPEIENTEKQEMPDHTKTSFLKTGKLSNTNYTTKPGNKPFTFPPKIKN